LSCYITKVLGPPAVIASNTTDSRRTCRRLAGPVTARRIALPCPQVQLAVVQPGRLLGCAYCGLTHCYAQKLPTYPRFPSPIEAVARPIRRLQASTRSRFGRPWRACGRVGARAVVVWGVTQASAI